MSMIQFMISKKKKFKYTKSRILNKINLTIKWFKKQKQHPNSDSER
jgi:hypothetical protein